MCTTSQICKGFWNNYLYLYDPKYSKRSNIGNIFYYLTYTCFLFEYILNVKY